MRSLFSVILFLSLISVSGFADPMRDNMTLHHIHNLINKASSLASEGSNLVMMGQMKMSTPEIDGGTVSQGMHLVMDASAILSFVANSKSLQEIKATAKDPGTLALLKYTQDLLDQSAALIQKLKNMPNVPMARFSSY